ISLSALPERVRDPATLLAHMRKDKKVRNGRVTLILPHRIGEVFVTAAVAADAILDVLGDAAGASSPADAVAACAASSRRKYRHAAIVTRFPRAYPYAQGAMRGVPPRRRAVGHRRPQHRHQDLWFRQPRTRRSETGLADP